ncbi:MAG TPA: gamma-glutamyl-gamma-aminobutyrate hydrolase family protein [Bryobacteraceae bacterium]|nr:gamma-glutamyl-gamma-aminobutyrate hydrolase family protein [Bryobacteraceae bacterium]
MRVVAFRHTPLEDVGLIEQVLESRGISLEFADLCREDALVPDIEDAAGLVFMGGPMSANDEFDYLRREQEWIARAADEHKPVLGVCLGAQLIARTLGARVYRNQVKEVGWFDIHKTDAAERDPLFSRMRETETVFHWHGETFDLPRGAEWLAYSEACRHQAFRVGEGIYGLQFHLEMTPEMITDWCTHDAACGDKREASGPIDAHQNTRRTAELAEAMFGEWCRLL